MSRERITLGSLFDGIGGFPYAASFYGIETIWAADIDPFVVRVVQTHFPRIKHYGRISLMDGSKTEPVDIITGGPLVKILVWQARGQALRARGPVFLSNRSESSRKCEGLLASPAIWCGKMCLAFLVVGRGRILELCSKKQGVSLKKDLLFLDLRKGSGGLLEPSWEMVGVSHGVSWTHSSGESPSVAVASSLSQILEDRPHPKYFLSPKACQGILRRAERREKELPEALKAALERQSQVP